jgi:hypothetical protein
MSDEFRELEIYRRILKLLEMQRRILVESHCDEELIRGYSSVLKYLAGRPKKDVSLIFGTNRRPPSRNKQFQLPQPDNTANLSLDDVERYVKDLETPRKLLEEIAVERFHFPRGSLRSLQNLVILREKIMTMVRNERAHRTISSLAERTGR